MTDDGERLSMPMIRALVIGVLLGVALMSWWAREILSQVVYVVPLPGPRPRATPRADRPVRDVPSPESAEP